eukprot:TRINITY_DN518_c0_g1_i3.p1 TRINITY_DN518_c0_g1~~TRINITY_DN518_c0_g1_i3.p1  ORF type:complete len:183 (-),score=9.02 TRINITY_DN518_c0_g1_i3:57-605(-)
MSPAVASRTSRLLHGADNLDNDRPDLVTTLLVVLLVRTRAQREGRALPAAAEHDALVALLLLWTIDFLFFSSIEPSLYTSAMRRGATAGDVNAAAGRRPLTAKRWLGVARVRHEGVGRKAMLLSVVVSDRWKRGSSSRCQSDEMGTGRGRSKLGIGKRAEKKQGADCVWHERRWRGEGWRWC